MDTSKLRLRIAGYDADGGLIDAEEIGLQYRPRQLRDLPPTAIGIIKSRQRLYYFENGKIRRMHIVSTAMPGYWTPLMHPGSYDPRRGRMGQVFYKDPAARSRRYDCWMYYWMAVTSSGSHGIHATSPAFYHRLGRPASHGCIRQHKADARKLFRMVKVGTPVYIVD
ncbi:MAG: L,D-transpeptidase [Armatimonadetes bacterium]|nr:L,D-transpeptidase [Armatimonadota bacterium]